MKIFHVLHLFPDPPAGGTERAVAALAASMKDVGHEVAVVAGSLELADERGLVERQLDGIRVFEIRRDDLYFESWEKSWSPTVSAEFRRLLEREQPDVVHVHHWIRMTSELVRVAREVGVAVTAVTLHDFYTQLASPVKFADSDAIEPPAGSPWLGAAEGAEALDLHRRDFTDEIRAAHLRYAPSRAHGIQLQQLAVGPLGEIRPAIPPLMAVPDRRVQRKERGKRLLYWGSIYPEKGLDTVLDALFSVQGGWELDVFGEPHDPDYGESLRRRVAGMPVRFHGAFGMRDLTSVEADYAILPSLCDESYGLVLDEAQCLGLPILASDLPAYREHVPAECCAFFPPNDPGSLAMLLLDEARLTALQVPSMPKLQTPRMAADALLRDYEDVRRGQHGPLSADVEVDGRARAEALFRRGERRLWSLLQQDRVQAPPDEFLRPAP